MIFVYIFTSSATSVIIYFNVQLLKDVYQERVPIPLPCTIPLSTVAPLI